MPHTLVLFLVAALIGDREAVWLLLACGVSGPVSIAPGPVNRWWSRIGNGSPPIPRRVSRYPNSRGEVCTHLKAGGGQRSPSTYESAAPGRGSSGWLRVNLKDMHGVLRRGTIKGLPSAP